MFVKRIVKYFSLFALVLCSKIECIAQDINVQGHIVDKSGKPIAFCVVQSTISKNQTYANENGDFTLPSRPGDSLLFFCLGYEKKTLCINQPKIDVVLDAKEHKIDDVIVLASKSPKRKVEHTMGKRKLKPSGICTGQIGNEKAIYLAADSSSHGILKKISFYIMKDGIPSSRFRVHVYDIDSNYLPGNNLLDSNVILHATTGDEWVEVDVGSQYIPVGRGIFISMEWISGFGNTTKIVNSRKYSAQTSFNGQVLGFTNDYYRQQSLYYTRKDNRSAWHFCYLGGTSKRNILNPMIFATYTFYR